MNKMIVLLFHTKDLLYLLKGLKKTRGMVKPRLLDQSFIAGLGNIYWVFDGYHSSIVRYDFATPHEIGGHDHSDGKVWRYDEVSVSRQEGVPSHMILDDNTGFLYIADTGNQRILKTGRQSMVLVFVAG